MITVGVDVGGTSVRAAAVAADGAVHEVVSTPTPTGRATDLDDVVVDLVLELADRHPVAAVGLAVAGFVDADRRDVAFGAHLPWRGGTGTDPLVERMGARMGMPVVLEHDANAAGLAEHRVGAAVGASVAVLLALGTGIGAALVVGGSVFRGAHGVAPELGHLTVVPGGRPCPCGKDGCLERYCSGTALAQSAREALDASDDPSTLRTASADPVTGRDVTVAAEAGDALAGRVVTGFAAWLGEAFALAADVFDPDVIVLGGEMSASSPLFLDAAVAHYGDRVTGGGHRRRAAVRPAAFGGRAGMVGAALDARERAG